MARLLLADAAPRAEVAGARATRSVLDGGSEEEILGSAGMAVSTDVLIWGDVPEGCGVADSEAAAAPARTPRRVPRLGALDIVFVPNAWDSIFVVYVN